MSCLLPNHDSQKIKYICIDKSCRVVKKIGCADCFLENHATHKRQRLDEYRDRSSKTVYNLRSLNTNILKEEDISLQDSEFSKIINKDLIDRQKVQTKEVWKKYVSQKLYESNKSNLDDSMQKIDQMEAIIKEQNFNQQKYLELAKIYFNPEFWTTLAENQRKQTQQLENLVKKKNKYFQKMIATTDHLLRDILFDEQKSTSVDEDNSEIKGLYSPENQKDSSQRKQIPMRTRHFGTTVQKLFSIPVSKRSKLNSP